MQAAEAITIDGTSETDADGLLVDAGATIAEAEAEKKSMQLRAEAELIQAEKNAEAIRVTADAEAYAVKAKAEADAEQTKLLATAIAKNGKPAVDFEIAKRQVDALSNLASAANTKTIILPKSVKSVK